MLEQKRRGYGESLDVLSGFLRRVAFSSDLVPLLFLGGTVLLLFLPYLSHPAWLIWPQSGLGSDVAHSYWVDHIMVSRAVREGRPPLWNDLNVIGHPMWGRFGSLWFYPLAFLYSFAPPALTFTLLNALHVFLAGVFMYFLIRALFKAVRPAAMLGALAFMLMPLLTAHLAGAHIVNVCGVPWMPAVLLGAWTAVQSRRLWPAALAGLALGLQVLTHPQMPISTVYLLIGMLGWKCWRALLRVGWRHLEFYGVVKWCIVAGAVTGGGAVLVAAIRWMPIAELLPLTARVEFETSVPFWYQLPPAMLLSLLSPTEFQFPEWTIYMGSVSLFLSVIALLGRRRRFALNGGSRAVPVDADRAGTLSR